MITAASHAPSSVETDHETERRQKLREQARQRVAALAARSPRLQALLAAPHLDIDAVHQEVSILERQDSWKQISEMLHV